MDNSGQKTSIEDFARDPRGNLRRIAACGEPEVLFVDDQPAAVVMDVQTYAKLMATLDEAGTVRTVMERLETYDARAALTPDEAFDLLETRHPYLKSAREE